MTVQVAIDGVPAGACPLDDRGLGLGDGLFETMAVIDGQVPAWPLHCRRLRDGLRRLRLPVLSESTLSASWRCLSLPQSGVVKLIVTAGSAVGGYARPASPSLRRMATVTDHLPQWPGQGVCLFDCQTRLAHQPQLAGIKHLCRLEQVLARSEWTDERFADGLMRDQDDRIIETTCANLFLYSGQGWITPDLSHCGVAGIMRERLLNYFSAQGEPVDVVSVDDERLMAASEVMIANSVRGIAPVIEYRDRRWPFGSRVDALQRALRDDPLLGVT